MKKILLGVVGLVALGAASPAVAADLAPRPYTKAPMMAPVVYDWSGFYVGLNGGGGWSHNCWTNTATFLGPTIPSADEGCHDASGGMVGGQIGYRWQAMNWVFGLEGQGDWADLKGSMPAWPLASPTRPSSTASACSLVRSAMPGTTCSGT